MRKTLAQRLKLGLTEGIEHARGERTLVTHEIDAPPGRGVHRGAGRGDSKAARTEPSGVREHVLMVNAKTLQSWEQGARRSSRPTMRLLQVFDQPAEFADLLGSLPHPRPPWTRNHPYGEDMASRPPWSRSLRLGAVEG